MKGRAPRQCCTFALLAGGLMLVSCNDVRRELPERIEIDEVVASSSSGFFMEGCARALYRLSDRTAEALFQQGANFFAGIEPPPNRNPRNPYSHWRETPLPDPREHAIHAVNATGGCPGDESDFRVREIEEALRQPGSFYALTSNREGMMLVAPRSKIAAFLYFG